MSPELLFEANRRRLAQLAFRGLARGHAARDLLVVCIQVDSVWRDLVEALMPGRDWQAMRDRGDAPIARGTVLRKGLAEPLSVQVPAIAGALASRPPPGTVHAVALGTIDGRGRASVYVLVPEPEPN